MVAGGGNVTEGPSVAALLAEARARGIERLDAEILLATLMHESRAHLVAFPETTPEPLTAAMFRAGLDRLASGEPLAYLTGIREFWSMPLVVTPAVLIPRPETELAVELALNRLDPSPRLVADLGTGSGAIALALARERPAWRILATDASSAALEVAHINRGRLQLRNIELLQGRWCEPLGDELCDAILSNPPYVAPGDPALALLGAEPATALVAGDNGYADLIDIAGGAGAHLKPGGLLLLEHGNTQRERLAHELGALGYTGIECHRDLAGHDRVTTAIWP